MKFGATQFIFICLIVRECACLFSPSVMEELENQKLLTKYINLMYKLEKTKIGSWSCMSVIPKNLIYNGAFERQSMRHQVQIMNSVQGWQVNKGEIGRGRIYNLQWNEQTIVAELDGQNNSLFTYPLKLEAGNYYAVFDWAPRENTPFDSSEIHILWNRIMFTKLTASKQQIYQSSMLFKSTGKVDKLDFAGAGTSDSLGATISNFKVYKIDMQPDFFSEFQVMTFKIYNFTLFWDEERENLIKNGDFETPILWSRNSYFSYSSIPNWQVEPIGEIGVAKLYNSDWQSSNGYVVQLDSKSNAQYTAQFNDRSPLYFVSFDSASCEHQSVETSRFNVSFNQNIFEIVPVANHVQRHFLKVSGNGSINSLTFSGSGTSDGCGATIDNIRVHRAK